MRKWRNSLILGSIAFLFSFGFSFVNNTWQTSLFRAVIGFLIFFLLGALVSIILNQMIFQQDELLGNNNQAEEEQNLMDKPKRSTEELGKEADNFQAMSLGALHNNDKESLSDEETAQVIRAMLKENRGNGS